ncbi:MAG TPA: hypothetical protein VHE80_11465 [Acidimicrobiales bacterium]|nr:hypothetical protein [Acidimicrobiales bacterium]
MGTVLECVVNVSEGRDPALVEAIGVAAGAALLDAHSDADHNRSVLTLAGADVEEAVRALARAAVAHLDLGTHRGVHPRIGVVDVVPFVPLQGSAPADAVTARDRFAAWAAAELSLPSFLFGPERSLPEVRRGAFVTVFPDVGPPRPHPTAGAAAVGARDVLVAYNLWLAPEVTVERARAVAKAVRGPGIRALGLAAAGGAQVSCNLIDLRHAGPDAAFDAVARLVPVARAELVGLVPASVLAAIPEHRWSELDLAPSRTIEARLERAGLPDGGPVPGGPA